MFRATLASPLALRVTASWSLLMTTGEPEPITSMFSVTGVEPFLASARLPAMVSVPAAAALLPGLIVEPLAVRV